MSGRVLPRARASRALSLLASMAYSLFAGWLVVIGGTPPVAMPFFSATIFMLSAAIIFLAETVGKSESDHWLSTVVLAAMSRLRRVPKASQFLIICFVVTSIFALEMRVDVVPNTFGLIELTVPVILSAIFFEVTGALFCGLITMIFGFKAITPLNFDAILDLSSFSSALLAFAALGITISFYFPGLIYLIHRATGEANELSRIAADGHYYLRRMAARSREIVRLAPEYLLPAMFLSAYALVWTIYSALSSGNGQHIDSLEAYAWGREFVLGYYKHPPFWAWVAGLWFLVFPKTDWWFWFLSELNGALGLLGAWALMGRFCDRRTQVAGILLLLLTPFYQFNAQRFNANTVLLSIWPWTMYFFVRSMEYRSIMHGILCGLIAGTALISKYFGFVLIGYCFIASVTHDMREQYYRSAAPYVAVLTTALVFTPHLIWLVHDGFQPLIYLSTRIDLADRHISNSYFQFIAANTAYFIIPILLVSVVRLRYGRFPAMPPIAAENGISFLNVLAFAPMVLTLVAGTVGHTALAVPFGVPIFALMPLSLIACTQPVTQQVVRWGAVVVALLVTGCLVASPFLPEIFLRSGGYTYTEPRREIADVAIRLWHEVTGAPLRYVSGGRAFSLEVTFRSTDNTSEFNSFRFRRSPWVSEAKLRSHGLLVICPSDEPACIEGAAPFRTAETVTFDREVYRQIGDTRGPPMRFEIVVIPPDP